MNKGKILNGALLFIMLIILGRTLLIQLGADFIDEWRFNRGMQKMFEQAPEIPHDHSIDEMKAVLISTFQDRTSQDFLLQITLLWSDDQWVLTKAIGGEPYFDSLAIQKLFTDILGPNVLAPVYPAPEGWCIRRVCEIVRMGQDLKVKINVQLEQIDTSLKKYAFQSLSPLRDFPYPSGQSPQDDLVQRQLRQQETHLETQEKEISILGEAIIIRGPGKDRVKVSMAIPQTFKEGVEAVLSSHYQSIPSFSSPITITVKDEWGEVTQESQPSMETTREKKWLIRIHQGDGALYYMEDQL